MNNLETFRSKIGGQNIMVVGDVMIDAYLWGKVDRISPEAPVPIVSVNRRENRLGGAANVALNIQALGATPILCSVLGNDIKSLDFMELLKEQNMPTDGIITSNDRITTVKSRIIGNNAQMLRIDQEITAPLSITDEELLTERIASHGKCFEFF